MVSVRKFNLSRTEFIRIINHLSVSCIRNSYAICKKKKKKKKEAETGERNLCMVQGILILINLDYG